VLDALVGMRERGIWIEVTTLLIPGANDAPGELAALARWITSELGPETPWHVSRFFPAYRMSDAPETPLETIRRAVETGRAAGLHHVYAGNVRGLADVDTRCARCGRVLFRRRGFSVVSSDLVRGACPECGHPLAGIGLTEPAAP
jgi:pyruvate formate lyase activating enzyme